MKKHININKWFKKPDVCLIIAEVGSTHNGDVVLARKLIDVASECGADIVKFQTHIANEETLRNAPNPPYFNEESRYDYFNRISFDIQQWKDLKKYAETKGLIFLSSSFSIAATNLLNEIGVMLHKVPSGEVTNIPYLEHMARSKKPVIMSSGMSNWQELDEAVNVFNKYKTPLVLLQCTTEYPVPPEKVGLNIILEMKKRYGVPVGLSDHSMHNYAAFASIPLGAAIIEKHITLNHDMYGSDAKHSLTPKEFKELVGGIRIIANILVSPRDKNSVKEFAHMKRIFQKSVVTTKALPKGTVLRPQHLTTKKPGTGIAPKHIKEFFGKILNKNVSGDYLLKWGDVK